MPKNTEIDIFIANSVYPDASTIFTLVPKKLVDIKNDCIVVIDTNALLVPYAVGKESLKQINKTYTSLVQQKRLIIPGQVAREFAKNRTAKLVEIFQQITQARNSFQASYMKEYPLLEDMIEYKNVLEMERSLKQQIQEYRNSIGKVLDQVQTWNWDDPVSLMYSEMFKAESIYDLKFDKERISNELEARYAHNIPPGYKDADKSDKGIGDFLIWKTILEIGQTRKKSVILVSNDAKIDWLHKVNDQVLYPRYELVDEFRRESQGHHFHLIQFSEFLNLYGASENVVQEVREKERTKEQPTLEFHIKSTRIRAFMRESGNRFVVTIGSQARKQVTDSFRWTNLRDELINSGVLVDKGEYYEFSEDTYFASTSAASSIILGRQSAGPLEWISDENKPYKEYLESSMSE